MRDTRVAEFAVPFLLGAIIAWLGFTEVHKTDREYDLGLCIDTAEKFSQGLDQCIALNERVQQMWIEHPMYQEDI